MNVIVDDGVGSVYVGLHKMVSDFEGGVTRTMEKHGILLHWNGHGKLIGVEFMATGEPVYIIQAEHMEDYTERE
jgi:hypothetical protein